MGRRSVDTSIAILTISQFPPDAAPRARWLEAPPSGWDWGDATAEEILPAAAPHFLLVPSPTASRHLLRGFDLFF